VTYPFVASSSESVFAELREPQQSRSTGAWRRSGSRRAPARPGSRHGL